MPRTLEARLEQLEEAASCPACMSGVRFVVGDQGATPEPCGVCGRDSTVLRVDDPYNGAVEELRRPTHEDGVRAAQTDPPATRVSPPARFVDGGPGLVDPGPLPVQAETRGRFSDYMEALVRGRAAAQRLDQPRHEPGWQDKQAAARPREGLLKLYRQ